jgi:hypothetical protein
MGQRHQIYIVSKKDNAYKALGAFHHQWCNGINPPTNLTRLAKLLEANKLKHGNEWSNYCCSDSREIETAVKATYGVSLSDTISMVHNENQYLISKNGQILPSHGDNNDGCSLLVIDNDLKQVRGCLFTPGHLERLENAEYEKNKAMTRVEYLRCYYKLSNLGKPEFIPYLDVMEKYYLNPILQPELDQILSEDKATKC